jgi:hypothetical protein
LRISRTASPSFGEDSGRRYFSGSFPSVTTTPGARSGPCAPAPCSPCRSCAGPAGRPPDGRDDPTE